MKPAARDLYGKIHHFWVRHIYIGDGQERLVWNGRSYVSQVISEQGNRWETSGNFTIPETEGFLDDAWTFLYVNGQIKYYNVIFLRGENEIVG